MVSCFKSKQSNKTWGERK